MPTRACIQVSAFNLHEPHMDAIAPGNFVFFFFSEPPQSSTGRLRKSCTSNDQLNKKFSELCLAHPFIFCFFSRRKYKLCLQTHLPPPQPTWSFSREKKVVSPRWYFPFSPALGCASRFCNLLKNNTRKGEIKTNGSVNPLPSSRPLYYVEE